MQIIARQEGARTERLACAGSRIARLSVSISLLVTGVGGTSVAQGGFGHQRTITTDADGAKSVFAADLNGDGALDVLSTSVSDHKVAWYENLNLGAGRFGPQQVITTQVAAPYAVVAADLDGDLDEDVLFVGFGNSELVWCENLDGLGTFGAVRFIASPSRAFQSVFAADLDGDLDLDVLTASSFDDTIAWHENLDGLGNFGPQRVIWAGADGATDVFAADIDGDGDMDVVSASYNDDTIAWYANLNGLGLFGVQRTITNLADGAVSVFVADLDGDQDLDVVSAASAGDEIAWYENEDGLGTFRLGQIITNLIHDPQSVFVTDPDGDGDLDVLLASRGDDTLAWYENGDGLGTFRLEQIITTQADGVSDVFAADLNGDLTIDALAASLYDDTIAWYPYGLLAQSVWYCGTAVNPDTFTVASDFVVGGTFAGSVTATGGNVGAILYLGVTAVGIVCPWGEVLISPPVQEIGMGFGDPAVIVVAVPDDPALIGFVTYVQAVGFGGGITLTCAYACTVGF